MKNKLIKILFIISIILLLIPSILYITNNKTIFKFNNYYTYTLTDKYTNIQEGIMYLAIMIAVSILYILIIKKQRKIFQNIKQIGIYIIIVSILFAFMLPNTSSDIYYYFGVGRMQNKYNANPYYESMNDVMANNEQAQKDEIMRNTPEVWRDITVVYGPVWTLMCNILTLISFNSVNWILVVFKTFNLIIHLLNCYMIYKITKKKLYVIIYGLNPLVLLEGIVNVHNDIFVVFLILMSLYFLLKKKNILLSVVFLGITAGIKYITLLLLPFILIYYFRKEKINIRFYKCIKYGIIFVLILLFFYLIYAQDLSILDGLSKQQGKFSKSISLTIYYLVKDFVENPIEYAVKAKNIFFVVFVIIYIIIAIWQLLEKNVKFHKAISMFAITLFIFMFVVLTTFQPWYMHWIFPIIMWQKPKVQKVLIWITVFTNLCNSIFIFFCESAVFGTGFVILMIISAIISILINSKITRKGDNLIGKEKISFNRWK